MREVAFAVQMTEGEKRNRQAILRVLLRDGWKALFCLKCKKGALQNTPGVSF